MSYKIDASIYLSFLSGRKPSAAIKNSFKEFDDRTVEIEFDTQLVLTILVRRNLVLTLEGYDKSFSLDASLASDVLKFLQTKQYEPELFREKYDDIGIERLRRIIRLLKLKFKDYIKSSVENSKNFIIDTES